MLIQKYTLSLALGLTIMGLSSRSNAQVVIETKVLKEANVKIYLTNYPADADVVVFKTPFIDRAQGNKGIWYFTDMSGWANKKICYVSGKDIANIVVCFTDDAKQAGWRSKKKQHFMD